MEKNSSLLIGDYLDNFVNSQVKSGKYSSASEVVCATLRMFEKEETKKQTLIKELRKGEESGFVEDFDRATFLMRLKENHSEK